MHFRDRDDAARQLADKLAHYRGQRPLVLGVPRGAVPMAAIIAEALEGDLDVVLVHKLRTPFQPELAMGAVDEGGEVLRYDTGAHVSEEDVAREVAEQRAVLRRRREAYTGEGGPTSAAGRVVIIMDDGIATGSSMLAAIHTIRRQKPARVVVATAVAPPDTLRRVSAEADEMVCLHSPREFWAVGQFFDDFGEVSDDDVVRTLEEARRSSQ
jgi:putative phosphoribosyl transferase